MMNTLGLQSIVFIFREIVLLTTQLEHELPNFPFAAGTGVHTWRAVTCHFGVTYVCVSYAFRTSGGWLPQTTIFWRHEDVLALCQQVNKDKKRKLLDVFLLAPADPVSGQQWQAVPIKEIYVNQFEEDVDFPLYVTFDGQTIGGLTFDGSDESALDGNVDYGSLAKVFPAPQMRPKAKQ
jgi:hypothetical protein